MGDSERIQVPYTLDRSSLKLVYRLDPGLPFGHLELNGVKISGYFQPDDGDTEYTCRHWMFEEEPEEPLEEPKPEVEPDPEDESE